MKVRKNFKQTSASGRAIEQVLNTSKQKCISFAGRVDKDGVSVWFDEIFVSFAIDTNSTKQLASESRFAFEERKREEAKKQLSLLTANMKKESDLNKLLCNANKLYTLCLDFAPAFYVDGAHNFAKLETIAFDKANLSIEQADAYERKCIDTDERSATYAKVTTFVGEEQKTYFVKKQFESVVTSFLAGSVGKLLSRRNAFDTLCEQDEIFFTKESAQGGVNIQRIAKLDKLTCDHLCKFIAFSLYASNKEKIKALQEERKRASKARKAEEKKVA